MTKTFAVAVKAANYAFGFFFILGVLVYALLMLVGVTSGLSGYGAVRMAVGLLHPIVWAAICIVVGAAAAWCEEC